MSKITRDELEVILEPIWELVYESEKPESDDSLYWLIIEALNNNEWTEEEYCK